MHSELRIIRKKSVTLNGQKQPVLVYTGYVISKQWNANLITAPRNCEQYQWLVRTSEVNDDTPYIYSVQVVNNIIAEIVEQYFHFLEWVTIYPQRLAIDSTIKHVVWSITFHNSWGI